MNTLKGAKGGRGLLAARLLDLQRFRRRLHGRTHDDLTARSARNGAANQEKVAVGIDADDLQIFDGATFVTHPARHALTHEYATRSLTLPDRARRTMRHGHTVGIQQTAEVMAFHDACITLTGGSARYV